VNTITRDAVTASSPTRVPALGGRDTADHADRDHGPERSWIWALVEALACAGASFDPVSALAARRFARLRDQELHGA
jgi:hypothetical protein